MMAGLTRVQLVKPHGEHAPGTRIIVTEAEAAEMIAAGGAVRLPPKIILRFLASCLPYNTGEVAGFEADDPFACRCLALEWAEDITPTALETPCNPEAL
jgi:hypothetical protein